MVGEASVPYRFDNVVPFHENDAEQDSGKLLLSLCGAFFNILS